jgi:hypothetical protein
MEHPWQLREWHIEPSTGAFRMHVLGTNPQPGLYGHEGLPNPLPPLMVKGFQETFVQQVVPQLLDADSKLRGVDNIDDQHALLINNIGILGQTVAPWTDFISNSQKRDNSFTPPRLDDPKEAAQNAEAFRSKISAAIGKAKVPNVDADQILVRAGATSCGGCHRFSSVSSEIGRDSAGDKIMWPGPVPGDFVHISERSELSDLLTKFFLADRCEKMNEIFFKPEGEKSASIVPAPNVLNMTLQQASPTALLNLQKRISSTQPDLKEEVEEVIRQITKERSDTLRILDRGTLGALGQIRHAD